MSDSAKKPKSLVISAEIGLLILAIWLWIQVFSGQTSFTSTHFYFLDVGQGDSELAILSGGAKILTDAGPDRKVVESIGKVLGNDKHIDLAVITHPQLDHFNGFYYLLDSYSFGAFIMNGRSDGESVKEWPALLEKIRAKKIPILILREGDSITQGENHIRFFSPDTIFNQSGELNDTAFVTLFESRGLRALFTADAGANVEKYLIKKGVSLTADILKVGHHGSKYSSSESFLTQVNPKVAAIEVGAKNTYHHPNPETLARLTAQKIPIFRTDKNGTIEMTLKEGKIQIYTEK